MFIKDLNLIEENAKVDDLLDFSVPIRQFTSRIQSIKRPSMIGLVGQYGSGKSTMLHQIQKEQEATELWINFDAWKYPDRKDLWEGFVIDFADQLGQKKEIINKIDGKSISSDVLGVVGNISEKFAIVPGLSSLVELIKKFIDSSPATRVFEIQHLLNALLLEQQRDILIVVEDIDRSGDAGIYFLETFNQYLRTLPIDRRVVVVVPVGDKNYCQHEEAYLKVFDYIEQFTPRNLGLSKFVEEVFVPELFEGDLHYPANQLRWTGDSRKRQIIEFLEQMLNSYPYITMRVVKLVLRQANQRYILQTNEGFNPDFRITLIVEFSKHIYESSTENYSYFQRFVSQNAIMKHYVFAAYIHAIIRNWRGIIDPAFGLDKTDKSPYDIKFVKRPEPSDDSKYPSFPWTVSGPSREKGYRICDFYFEY